MASTMTITEKILALHAGVNSVSPGELIEVGVGLIHAKKYSKGGVRH